MIQQRIVEPIVEPLAEFVVVWEQIVDVPVPRTMEDDVVRSTPQERVQNRTLEQIVDFPVPQILEVYAGIVRAAPQERVQNRIPDPTFVCGQTHALTSSP